MASSVASVRELDCAAGQPSTWALDCAVAIMQLVDILGRCWKEHVVTRTLRKVRALTFVIHQMLLL